MTDKEELYGYPLTEPDLIVEMTLEEQEAYDKVWAENQKLVSQLDAVSDQRDTYRAERDRVTLELKFTDKMLDRVLSRLGSSY